MQQPILSCKIHWRLSIDAPSYSLHTPKKIINQWLECMSPPITQHVRCSRLYCWKTARVITSKFTCYSFSEGYVGLKKRHHRWRQRQLHCCPPTLSAEVCHIIAITYCTFESAVLFKSTIIYNFSEVQSSQQHVWACVIDSRAQPRAGPWETVPTQLAFASMAILFCAPIYNHRLPKLCFVFQMRVWLRITVTTEGVGVPVRDYRVVLKLNWVTASCQA